MIVICNTCGRLPSERYGIEETGEPSDICDNPLHDLADKLVNDLMKQCNELGIPSDEDAIRAMFAAEELNKLPTEEKP